jgi:hypothetical protein
MPLRLYAIHNAVQLPKQTQSLGNSIEIRLQTEPISQHRGFLEKYGSLLPILQRITQFYYVLKLLLFAKCKKMTRKLKAWLSMWSLCKAIRIQKTALFVFWYVKK